MKALGVKMRILILVLLLLAPKVNAMAFNEDAIKIIQEGKVLGSRYPDIDGYAFQVTLEYLGKIYDCTIVPKGVFCMEVGQFYLK